MIKTLWTSAAVCGLALAAGACAQTGAADTSASATTPPAVQTSQPVTAASITDAELQAFLAAREEIRPITARYASMSSAERTQATQQIIDIQRRHNMTAARYDQISRAVRSDPELATRVAAAQGFSDQDLHAFAAASLQIDPITRSLATATPAQQQSAAEQIRQILQQHNLDGATYNAIVAQAQTDPALSQRIATLQLEIQAEANEASNPAQ